MPHLFETHITIAITFTALDRKSHGIVPRTWQLRIKSQFCHLPANNLGKVTWPLCSVSDLQMLRVQNELMPGLAAPGHGKQPNPKRHKGEKSPLVTCQCWVFSIHHPILIYPGDQWRRYFHKGNRGTVLYVKSYQPLWNEELKIYQLFKWRKII